MVIQLERIQAKFRARRLALPDPLPESHVRSFEKAHGVVLPEEYRTFVTRIGNGAPGPPSYGLEGVGAVAVDMRPLQKVFWSELPHVRDPFPFTRPWVWDTTPVSEEGTVEEAGYGSIYIGNDGCGMYWALIVTGTERGIPWMISDEGVQPVCPRRGFLQWVEDWLDGKDSFYGYPHKAEGGNDA